MKFQTNLLPFILFRCSRIKRRSSHSKANNSTRIRSIREIYLVKIGSVDELRLICSITKRTDRRRILLACLRRLYQWEFHSTMRETCTKKKKNDTIFFPFFIFVEIRVPFDDQSSFCKLQTELISILRAYERNSLCPWEAFDALVPANFEDTSFPEGENLRCT